MTTIPDHYHTVLKDLKERIRQAQVKAALAVNKELVLLYWHIGKEILTRQDREGWGTKVIERLADDLRKEFPGMKGLSPRNIKYMRMFAENWPEEQFVHQLGAQIPWKHNVLIIEKIKEPKIRKWYVQKTIKHGWSRAVLWHQIESDLHNREGKIISNFKETLPPAQSDLAQETLKDPYVFDFIGLTETYTERELEYSLTQHITQFLLELGAGFAYIGKQVPLQVGSKEFFIDLLFYHTRLHCHVVIELKTKDFEPEHAGKLNFYIRAVDELIKHPEDKPTIGLLLCKNRDHLVAEWSLKDIHAPIGISEYQLTNKLPAELQSSLPTVEQIESELQQASRISLIEKEEVH